MQYIQRAVPRTAASDPGRAVAGELSGVDKRSDEAQGSADICAPCNIGGGEHGVVQLTSSLAAPIARMRQHEG